MAGACKCGADKRNVITIDISILNSLIIKYNTQILMSCSRLESVRGSERVCPICAR